MITITTPTSMFAPWETGPETPQAETQSEANGTPQAMDKPLDIADDLTNETDADQAASQTAIPDGDGLTSVVNSGIGDCVAYGIPGDIYLEEHALLDPIYKVQREIRELTAREKELDDQLHEVRSELEASRSAKDSLLAALPARLLEIREGTVTGGEPATDANADQDPAPAEATAKPAVVDDNAWRAVETVTITKDVVGLGPKKIKDLIEKYPTIGELIDALAQARAAHKHFATVLPKGIGKNSADELESRALAVQTKGDTRPASEVVEPRTSEETQSKLKHEQWVRATVASLRSTADEDSLKTDVGESWVDGFDAAKAGEKATDCPRELTSEHQTDWLKGWLHFDLFARDLQTVAVDGPQESLPGEGAVGSTVETVNETDVSLSDDDEAEIEAKQAEHVKFVNATLAWLDRFPDERDSKNASDKKMWQIGVDAFIEDVPAEDCPTEVVHPNEELAITEAMQVDWLRGWSTARNWDTNDAADQAPADPVPLADVSVSTLSPPANDQPVSEQPAGEQPADEQPGESDDPTNLEALAEAIKNTADRKPVTDKQAWDKGYTAAIDEHPLEACPKLPPESQLDWIRGWVSGNEMNFGEL